jgi:leucyl/phenylalanyl-tRNA--protein transferase
LMPEGVSQFETADQIAYFHTMPVYLLDEKLVFPRAELSREDGLLAVGGDLSVPRLLLAYRQGIFPWYNPEEPILWWSPDPRLVLEPSRLHVSKRLQRTIRQGRFCITLDTAFEDVIGSCSRIRIEEGQGTWLTPEMIRAYSELHSYGLAHSAEAWEGSRLVAGVYGLAIGKVFFGESMFTRISDASKAAFVTMVRQLEKWDFALIDCQMSTAHLKTFGAVEMARSEFLERLKQLVHLRSGAPPGLWKGHPKPGGCGSPASTAA